MLATLRYAPKARTFAALDASYVAVLAAAVVTNGSGLSAALCLALTALAILADPRGALTLGGLVR
jgi:hypothetical protein